MFLKEVDEKRGAYDLTSAEILPQKYPIELRDRIAKLVNANYDKQKTENDYIDNERCVQKDVNGDVYWHCSSPKVAFAIPIEITVNKIRDEMLSHVSESYLDEHFNLISTGDRIVANGKETPVGQYLIFTYSIDGLKFRYDVSTRLDNQFDEVYLRFFTPPKEIDSIIHDTQQIDELIYSCLEPDMYKILWQPYSIGNHIEAGFSPVIAGDGPPTVYDRWRDDPIQRSEKTFRVWLANGDVECRESRGEFVPDKKGRSEEILLIDSTEFHRLQESNKNEN